MGRCGARATALLLLAFVFCLAGCATGARQAAATATARAGVSVRDYSATIVSGGLSRSYSVHVPRLAGAGTPLPLVLALHGRLGTGEGQAQLTDFNAVADQFGFIVVYPDGYQRSWADGRGTTPADKAGVDDVAFLGAVLDQVMARVRVDAARIYVTGMSNGGFMTERLGCDLARRFAAIAVVAANFDQRLAARCAPSHALPVLLIHGSDDPLVPEAGGVMDGEPILSTAATVQRWASLDDCDLTAAMTHLPQTVSDGTSVQRSTYSGCQGSAQVVYYDILGGGHTWPDGLQYLPVSLIGKTSRNLDASTVIWRFFQRYVL
jgi:polyhydroxybutyrate depolymerase